MSLLFLNIGGLEIFVLVLPAIFYLYSFYRLVVARDISTNERLIWVVVFLIFNVLGAIAYWIWGNSNKGIRSSRY